MTILNGVMKKAIITLLLAKVMKKDGCLLMGRAKLLFRKN